MGNNATKISKVESKQKLEEQNEPENGNEEEYESDNVKRIIHQLQSETSLLFIVDGKEPYTDEDLREITVAITKNTIKIKTQEFFVPTDSPEFQWTKKGAAAMAMALIIHSNLVKLTVDISPQEQKKEEQSPMLGFLTCLKNTRIESICFNFHIAGSDKVALLQPIANILEENSSIKNITLSEAWTPSPEIFKDFITKLAANKKIQTFSIDGIPLTKEYLSILAKAVFTPHLRSLTLNNCALDNDMLRTQLYVLLEPCMQLKQLDLTRNRLLDEESIGTLRTRYKHLRISFGEQSTSTLPPLSSSFLSSSYNQNQRLFRAYPTKRSTLEQQTDLQFTDNIPEFS